MKYMTKVLVDSNILVYTFDARDDKKQPIAIKTISKLTENKTAVISIQNIVEFCRIVTQKLPNVMSFEEARAESIKMKNTFDLIYYNTDTVIEALTILKYHKTHFFDALLVATMKQHQIYTIITENDKDFSKIPGIKAINPFKN